MLTNMSVARGVCRDSVESCAGGVRSVAPLLHIVVFQVAKE